MKFKFLPVCTRIDTPLGAMLLAASPDGLVGLWFDGQRHQPASVGWQQDAGHPLLRQAAEQLLAYFAGTRQRFELPLDWRAGTPFQQAVWQALTEIDFGQTLSYGELGQRLGRPDAARAVAGAVGHNPLSVVVPCHRVLGADGALTGYAGGLARKAALLRLEGVTGFKEPV